LEVLVFRFDYKNLKEIQARKTLKAAKATKAKLEFVGHYRYVVIQQDAPKSAKSGKLNIGVLCLP
jgi:hypothetical protein